jgi:glycosyltransferase involved in cell wall biosynthesis
MMFGHGDPVASANFAQVLDRVNPSLVHFHAFSPAVSIRCLNECVSRGIPSLATYHTPTTSCMRGTLMRWGDTPCDGRLDPSLCAPCFLNQHGLPRPFARAATVLSRFTRPLAALPGLPNAPRAVLQAHSLCSQRLDATRAWWSGQKRVIALCAWTQKLLQLNAVPDSKIVLVRHGLPFAPEAPTPALSVLNSAKGKFRPVRLAFLGRLDPTKGIDLILDALALRPSLSVTLDLFTVSQPGSSAAARQLHSQASADTRMQFRTPVSPSEVVATLRQYNALLVPSRWMETGPLVVLEAFAAGIPVIGSRLGGIAEWVTHEHNGLLVDHMTPEAWAQSLARLVDEHSLLPRLTNEVKSPRSMREVANELMPVYEQVAALS